jgi:hypothetical protein
MPLPAEGSDAAHGDMHLLCALCGSGPGVLGVEPSLRKTNVWNLVFLTRILLAAGRNTKFHEGTRIHEARATSTSCAHFFVILIAASTVPAGSAAGSFENRLGKQHEGRANLLHVFALSVLKRSPKAHSRSLVFVDLRVEFGCRPNGRAASLCLRVRTGKQSGISRACAIEVKHLRERA